MYPKLAPVQISPVFTLQLHLDCRNMESTHYSEVKAVRRRDAGKKDGESEGWMGGASAWLQSQLWIGCCPSNGTSDLIYPLAHLTPYAHPALARPHLFCRTRSLTAFFAWELKLFSLCPFFPPHAPLRRVATSTRSRWGSQVRPHFLLPPCWGGAQSEATFQHAALLVEKYKRARGCQTALLSIYIVDSNFIPPRKVTGTLIFRIRPRPHMVSGAYAWQGSATKGDDGFCRPAAVSKWFRWIGFHTDGSCGPEIMQFSSAPTAVAIHPVVLLSPTEWTHTHMHTDTHTYAHRHTHTHKRTYAITGRK